MSINAELWQKHWYLENTGKDKLPEQFPAGSEGFEQFAYNPRTKRSRAYFEQTFGKRFPPGKKQSKKSAAKTPSQDSLF